MNQSADRGTHIALLRGINVGGRHQLPMKELTAIFAEAGASGIRTYIQSGNVVFDAAPSEANDIAHAVEEVIVARYGFTSPVIVRTAEGLRRAVAANPFLAIVDETKRLHVGFLEAPPAPRAVAALDPDRSPPDRIRVVGRELYLDLPDGVARTRFTSAYLDRTLGTVCTLRNWRTTLALLELVGRG